MGRVKNVIHIFKEERLTNYCGYHGFYHWSGTYPKSFCKHNMMNISYCNEHREDEMVKLPIDIEFLQQHHFDVCDICAKKVGRDKVYG
jgi:hypothetical protein